MENENQSKSGINPDQELHKKFGRRQSDIPGTNYDQSADNARRLWDTETNSQEGGDPRNNGKDGSVQEDSKPDPNDPRTLYNYAMERFDPKITEYPQLAEHLVYRDADFEREGWL